MSQPVFEIRNLYAHYGSKAVLKNLNFTMRQGQFFSIIGPNGSGKSTLLKVLNGTLGASQGKACFQGKLIEDYRVEELARSLAVINQGSSIRFPFRCLEIVMMGRHPHIKRSQQFSRADMEIVYEAMRKTETLEFADTLITEVSGGEFQRVMFARALAQTPQVLLLDEAFSGLDISHHIHSLKLLQRLVRHEGLTVVAIMHDLNLAYLFSEQVLALKKGEIQGFDCPQTLLDEHFIQAVFDVKVQRIEDKGLFVVP